MWRTKILITQSTSDLSTKHQKFIWEHHIWCHVNISEVVTLVSMIPNFWSTLEVVAAELHLCFVITGNLWWKSTFLPTVTFVVLHQKCRRWIVFSRKTSKQQRQSSGVNQSTWKWRWKSRHKLGNNFYTQLGRPYWHVLFRCFCL